jgi:hypothetical protein
LQIRNCLFVVVFSKIFSLNKYLKPQSQRRVMTITVQIEIIVFKINISVILFKVCFERRHISVRTASILILITNQYFYLSKLCFMQICLWWIKWLHNLQLLLFFNDKWHKVLLRARLLVLEYFDKETSVSKWYCDLIMNSRHTFI